MSDQIYRLKRAGSGSSSSSSGSWSYYEDEENLKVALFETHIDLLAASDESSRGQSLATRLAVKFRAGIMGKKDRYPRWTGLFAAERHTDAGWVPVVYQFIEPDIRITETIKLVPSVPSELAS